MNILLSGYFDKNLGDDAMHRLVVSSFPEHKFYVNFNQMEMLTHLEEFDNVCINKPCSDIDLFLNVIGTGFMYKGKRAKAEKLISMLTQKKVKYKKSALLNCSLESFDSPLARRFANSDLSTYGLITCRDTKSYSYLTVNIKNARIEQYPDMVFSAPFTKSAPSDSLLGVAPVRRVYSGDNYSYYLKLAKLCDDFCDNHSYKVRIFAFDNGLENDVSAAVSVKELMKNKQKAEVVIYSGSPDKTANMISECTHFVGSRFHSIVIAKLMNVNSLAVYDMEKLEALCTQYDIPMISKSDFMPDTAKKLLFNTKMTDADHSLAKGHIEALKKYINS